MAENMERFLKLMEQLRHPERGCPWDLAQTFQTIAPYTVEEAYEVLDAVDRGVSDDLRDELGDLLLQIVFHARIAEEKGAFKFSDIVDAIIVKLIRRHPHIFASDGEVLTGGSRVTTVAEAEASWEARKAEERKSQSSGPLVAGDEPDLLGSITPALPALTRAQKVSRKAADHGFDWPDASSVTGKVREEVDEVAQALEDRDHAALSEEIGDLLFSVVNLARHAGVDAETALRAGTRKFERRFVAMARHLAATGQGIAASDLAAMEVAWASVKRAERKPDQADDGAPRMSGVAISGRTDEAEM